MEALFKDTAVQESFEKNGFVIIDAIGEEQINELKAFYQETGIIDERGYGFHVSMDNTNKSLVNNIINKIYEVALPSIQPHFVNSKPYIASFVVKDPSPKGIVPVHQDWTFVDDEVNHNSMTVWIPLVDTTMENGALSVIRGSHKFFDQIRPSPSPQVTTPLENHLFTIFPYMEILEMKAGQALVFDNRTFHASPPNVTEGVRLAIGIGMTQTSSQLCHYSLDPTDENKVLKFKVDEEFFRKYDNARLSRMYDAKETIQDYELVDTITYDVKELTAEEMVKLIQDAGNQINLPLVTQLAKLFNYNPDGTKKEDKSEQKEVPKQPFWKVYTPINVIKEILFRMGILK